MRRLIQTIGAVGAAISLAGCATTSASSHVESGLDFTRFYTYEWVAPDAFPAGDPRLDRNIVFLDYLQGAVEKQMASKGYVQGLAGRSDLLVHFHASIDRRLKIDEAGANYGCPTDNCRNGVAEYEAGTLIVDVVDRRTKRLIWRGWSQRSVDDVFEDSDRLVRMIEEGVTRMFVTFPAAVEKAQRP